MLKSFSYAIAGILEFFMKERNAKIHLTATVAVIMIGFLLHLSNMEWIIVTIAIMSVLVAEIINTSIESLCNLVHPETHEEVRIIKDLAAGAVLLTSVASVIIAALIFIPKICS